MSDIVEDLRGRARGYRIGGPSSAHTAVMLETAADEIERLRKWNEEIALNAREFAEALREIKRIVPNHIAGEIASKALEGDEL